MNRVIAAGGDRVEAAAVGAFRGHINGTPHFFMMSIPHFIDCQCRIEITRTSHGEFFSEISSLPRPHRKQHSESGWMS